MKKILFGILTFLGIGLSFCSADSCNGQNFYYFFSDNLNGDLINCSKFDSSYIYIGSFITSTKTYFYDSGGNLLFNLDSSNLYLYECHTGDYLVNELPSTTYMIFKKFPKSCVSFNSSPAVCEDKDITVFYNSGSSTSITCDGLQAIEIKGLSTLTSTNTFTPFFNISYKDEDNQNLVESYSKDILYLENGQFKKTYTGNNDWILSVQGGSENSFSGYLPTFEITGGIEDVSESGNIFNNFAENSVKFTLSNIPSYIQYVIILLILFFIIGFIRKFRK